MGCEGGEEGLGGACGAGEGVLCVGSKGHPCDGTVASESESVKMAPGITSEDWVDSGSVGAGGAAKDCTELVTVVGVACVVAFLNRMSLDRNADFDCERKHKKF